MLSDPILLYSIQLVAIMSLALLGIGYLKAEPHATSARLFALITAFAILYVIYGMSASHVEAQFRLDIARWRLFMDTAIGAIPGLFMIYCFLVFQEQRQFPRWLGILFALQVLLEAGFSLLRFNEVDNLALQLLRTGLDILELSFICLAIYWTLKGWRNDLVEDRRALRWMIIILQGALILVVVVVENFLLASSSIDDAQAQFLLVAAIAVIVTAMLVVTMQFDTVSLGRVIRRVTEPTEENDAASPADFDIDAFNCKFRDTRLYREAGLTIASLAGKLNLPEYRLRAFIHKTLGYRNFNAMLHQYRIEDACEALADPENRNVPVLTIALTVGYQSITPFNNAFREIMGVTPSEYRKRKLNGDH
jgi:AraC-like DNA-binding protein